MFDSAKRSQQVAEEEVLQERRKSSDRRITADETRFPFIDDDCKLVMKDRRSLDRRTSDTRLTKIPLKRVNKLFKK